MRCLAVLVLLLQLQPVIGSVLCFHDTELSRPECAMPHDERPQGAAVTAAGADVPAGCANTLYCARSTPAVVNFAAHLQIVPLIQGTPSLLAASMASDAASAPPFHPPKA